jgi:hypothetical protein
VTGLEKLRYVWDHFFRYLRHLFSFAHGDLLEISDNLIHHQPPLNSGAHLLCLARIFHELLSRDHEDGRATGQPQGVGSEAYLNGTSQGPTPEDARKDGHIRGRSK